MQGICLNKLIKIVLSLFLTAIYFFIVWIAYVDIGREDFFGIIRHAILITGFVPWCFWMFVLLSREGFKLIPYAILITAFHVFVFAVTAHYDGLIYSPCVSLVVTIKKQPN